MPEGIGYDDPLGRTPQNPDPTIDNWLRNLLGGPKGPLEALGVLPQSPTQQIGINGTPGPVERGIRMYPDFPSESTIDENALELLSPGEEAGGAVRPSFGDIPLAQGQDDPAEPPRGFHPGYPGLAPETTTTPRATAARPSVAATDQSGMDLGDILSGVGWDTPPVQPPTPLPVTPSAPPAPVGAPTAQQPSPVTTPIPVPTPAIQAAATGQETFAGDDAMGGQLPGSPGGLISKLGGGLRREILDPLLRALINREGGSADAAFPNYEPDPVPAPNIPQAVPAPVVPTPTVEPVPDMPDSNLVQQPPPPPPPLPPQAPRSCL